MKIKEFMLDKLKKYSSIPSLYREEISFLRYLKDDFDRDNPPGFWREVYYNSSPYYFYRRNLLPSSLPYFLVVHTDRVPDRNSQPYINTIQENYPGISDALVGQLDNIISISVVRYLIYKQIPIDILFTTQEELSRSAPQIEEVCKLDNKTPIVLDIDIFDSTNYTEILNTGMITLRDRDNMGEMHPSIMEQLRNIATDENIPFTIDNGEAIAEAGFLYSYTKGKFSGAYVGIPLINYHSDKEVTSWKVVYNIIQLLENFLNKEKEVS